MASRRWRSARASDCRSTWMKVTTACCGSSSPDCMRCTNQKRQSEGNAAMTVLKWANLAVAFLLELSLLAALAYWGYRVGGNTVVKIALAIGAPLLMAVVWGTFMAPKAALPLPGPLHLALAFVLFGLGVAALYAVGQSSLALGFALAVVTNQIL